MQMCLSPISRRRNTINMKRGTYLRSLSLALLPPICCPLSVIKILNLFNCEHVAKLLLYARKHSWRSWNTFQVSWHCVGHLYCWSLIWLKFLLLKIPFWSECLFWTCATWQDLPWILALFTWNCLAMLPSLRESAVVIKVWRCKVCWSFWLCFLMHIICWSQWSRGTCIMLFLVYWFGWSRIPVCISLRGSVFVMQIWHKLGAFGTDVMHMVILRGKEWQVLTSLLDYVLDMNFSRLHLVAT